MPRLKRDTLDVREIIGKLDSGSVQLDPYPHLVIPDFLPPEIYQELDESYPDIETIVGRGVPGNNRRHQINAATGLGHTKLSDVWEDFVRILVSKDWWQAVAGVFTEGIRLEHPELENMIGKPLAEFDVGVRGVDKADVLLDCQPGINTPVTKKSSVRGPHIDNPVELFGGLLYFRDPADDSEGGDLLLCRHRNQNPVFWGKAELLEEDVIIAERVPYAANTLVLFVNSINAVHGVSPRTVTSYPRRLVNIIGEVYQGGGLFQIPRDRSLWGRIKNRWYQRRYGW